ncbi:hypothetical protein [Halobacterium noricense]|nr:hypothetical protein [Halobacterium noricense]UHH26435.1 hypothetical protein LT974_05730 [Halobacterium noricense]
MIPDLESFEVLRRDTGEDYETAHVPDRAEALLARYEETVAHYEVRT